jgi:hypothetical protein
MKIAQNGMVANGSSIRIDGSTINITDTSVSMLISSNAQGMLNSDTPVNISVSNGIITITHRNGGTAAMSAGDITNIVGLTYRAGNISAAITTITPSASSGSNTTFDAGAISWVWGDIPKIPEDDETVTSGTEETGTDAANPGTTETPFS